MIFGVFVLLVYSWTKIEVIISYVEYRKFPGKRFTFLLSSVCNYCFIQMGLYMFAATVSSGGIIFNDWRV